jgi:hypothetical protein
MLRRGRRVLSRRPLLSLRRKLDGQNITTGAEARLICSLYAALKRRSSTYAALKRRFFHGDARLGLIP